MKHVLTKQAVDADPSLLWNTYVYLIASEYRQLEPQQRPAHLVFCYESEIQNGGHLQYFENRGTEYLNETVKALGLLGASCHQRVLLDAIEIFLRHPRQHINTVEEFSTAALEGEFAPFDSRFHNCDPPLLDCLESHLKEHQSLFITLM
jgi:hypothetical protein